MGRDAIAVVEAAYSLGGDNRSWLVSVSEAARPLLDAGLGVVSYFFDMRRPSEEWLDPPVSIGSGDEFARALAAVHRRRPAAERVLPYLDPRPARTASEIFARAVRAPGSTRADAGREVAATLGFADLLRVKAHGPDHTGCVLSAPLPVLSRVSPGAGSRWGLVATHVGTALRLRSSRAPVAAILDDRGGVVHLRVNESRAAIDTLRAAAATIDQARGPLRKKDPDRALAVWSALLCGKYSLVERFDTDGRRYWIARENAADARDPRGLSVRERAVASLVARGHSNKSIGFELGVAEGTICAHVDAIRRKLGAGSRAALVSALAPPRNAAVAELRLERDTLVVLDETAAHASALHRLTKAEREVASAVAGGASNRDVARLRGTSIYTIMNQLHEIYRKLGIQSRAQLAAHVWP